MKIINKPPSEKSQRILESLTRAVAQELDKKKTSWTLRSNL